MKRVFLTVLLVLNFVLEAHALPVACQRSHRDLLGSFGAPNAKPTHDFETEYGQKLLLKESNKPYLDFQYSMPVGAKIEAMPGSFAEHSKKSIQYLNDLERFFLMPDDFAKQYIAVHKAVPGVNEYQMFYRQRLQTLEEGFAFTGQLIGHRNPEFLTKTSRAVEERIAEIRKNLGEYDALPYSEQVDFGNKTLEQMKGLLGEIRAAMVLPHLELLSAKLGKYPAWASAKSEAIGFMKEELTQRNGWENLLDDFPSLFDRKFKFVPDRKVPEVTKLLHWDSIPNHRRVDTFLDWMNDREYDAILRTKVNGETRWTLVEVKNNRDPISVEKMKNRKYGKSYFDQLDEAIDMMKLLGIKDQVDITFFPLGGMLPSARKEIMDMGVNVLPAQVIPNR